MQAVSLWNTSFPDHWGSGFSLQLNQQIQGGQRRSCHRRVSLKSCSLLEDSPDRMAANRLLTCRLTRGEWGWGVGGGGGSIACPYLIPYHSQSLHDTVSQPVSTWHRVTAVPTWTLSQPVPTWHRVTACPYMTPWHSFSLPDTVSQPVPDTLSQPVPDALSQPVPDTLSQPVPDAVSQPVPTWHLVTACPYLTPWHSQSLPDPVSQPVPT